MAIYHLSVKVLSRGGRNTVRAIAYRAGCELYDHRTDQTFDYADKPVQHVELTLPQNAPEWAKDIQKLIAEDRQKGVQTLCDMVEAAEKRIDARLWREFEFALHRELTEEQNMALARAFVEEQLCSHGMIAQLNFHFDVDEKTGEDKPHCHVVAATRRLEEHGLSAQKDRDWNKKEVLLELREQWAHYSNAHLKLHGHDVQIDHRSHKERGIEVEPQPKLGRNILEQEKRVQQLEGMKEGKGFTPVTEKMQAFQAARIRNLYRIMRQPDVVFDIVTKHHATFMWGDVQKVLHRYVNEISLFQRLEDKLRNSKELLVLRPEGVGLEERAIYTTRSMLKAEKELVETAENLASHLSHAISPVSLHHGLFVIQEKLKEKGSTLSEGQEEAIRHVVAEGQLKCLVGYAGAGKTTALEACRETWEAEGYRVYGLAPTGRAAQNLEGSGIPSQTLHKFLKAFEGGRCQYDSKSILVLDEAGMVDVERFDRFLNAVKILGVKAVVVGDGAQLQPVEAGPAFRLVTERVGVSRLEEIVRQKEEWQKEATILFGKQESAKAIQAYQGRGHVHLIEEKLPEGDAPEDIVKRYEIGARLSGLIFREIMKDVQTKEHAQSHEDYPAFLKWRALQKEAGKEILNRPEIYKPLLEARGLDPTELARLFVNKDQPKEGQYKDARALLKAKNLDSLIGKERAPGQTIEVRSEAKTKLIAGWFKAYKENPHKTMLMMAYSNRDVRDLNTQARDHLKASGHLVKDEMTYTITREIEDDFGRKSCLKETREFAKGDRIVFTRNNDGLGVKNGSMGTITNLTKSKVQVQLDEGKDISFSPNLNPYFDQGWAVTIHKSQGTTVDRTFVLASYEMTQNLTYVAMTRHREDVHMYGSTFDFWRSEKLPEVLSKSGEKLSAADYLDADSLSKLMQKEDQLLTKIFNRISNELEAMGAVTKQAFWSVADHFLGIKREKEIRVSPLQEGIREEARANGLFQEKNTLQAQEKISPALTAIFEEMKHPAFNNATIIKEAFKKGLKAHGEEQAIAYWNQRKEDFLKPYSQSLAKVERELISPLLNRFTIQWKDQTHAFAEQDPTRVLNVLTKVKTKEVENYKRIAAEEKARQEKVIVEERAAQERQAHRDHIKDTYLRFQSLYDMVKDTRHIPEAFKEDLKKFSKELAQDHDFMNHLKLRDSEEVEKIKQVAQSKDPEEHFRSLDRGRGGYSL